MCTKEKNISKAEKIQNTNAVLITEENEDIDVLDRAQFIDLIVKTIGFYSEHKKTSSISLQGTWGSGKSWIVNKVYNELYNVEDFENCGSKYCVFIYNAWDYDYYDEPLISLFISIYKQLNNEGAIFLKNEETRQKVEIFFSQIKSVILDDLLNIPFLVNIVEFKKKLDEKKQKSDDKIRKYDYHFDINQIMESTLKGLNKISKDKTIVLFVDELDRCLPNYAIKVLERLHHIKQNVQNIQIVYSFDKSALTKTIQNLYGDIDIKKYLAKFIDFELKLPFPKINKNTFEKYAELFNEFDFVNCPKNTNIQQLFLRLLPDTIEIRNLQQMFKKIIFINQLLNDTQQKLDYSILIVELFIAIVFEIGFDVKGLSLIYDRQSQRATLFFDRKLGLKEDEKPEEIGNFISTISCTGIYEVRKNMYGNVEYWIKGDSKNISINAMVLYHIARLFQQEDFYTLQKLDFLTEKEKFLEKFLFYYKILEI